MRKNDELYLNNFLSQFEIFQHKLEKSCASSLSNGEDILPNSLIQLRFTSNLVLLLMSLFYALNEAKLTFKIS